MPKPSAPAPKAPPKTTPDAAPQTELRNFSDKQRDEWLLKGDVSASVPAKGTPKKDAKANGHAGAAPKNEEAEVESPELELAGGGTVFSETETEGAAPKTDESESPEASAAAPETAPKPPPTTPTSDLARLETENKSIKAKVEQLERERASIVTPVAPKDAPKEPLRNDTDEHGLPKYATDDAFRDAQRKWDREQAKFEAKQELATDALKRADTEIQKLDQRRWTNEIAICHAKYPDFDIKAALGIDKDGKVDQAKVHPEFAAIRLGSALDRWVLDSGFGAELVRYLVMNPGEAERLQSFRSVDATVQAFAEVRSKILAGVGGKRKAAETVNADEVLERLSETNEEVEELAPPAPPTRRVTEAPAPGTRGAGGGRGTAPKDPVLHALRTGNFEDYQRLENEAELSRLKAGVN